MDDGRSTMAWSSVVYRLTVERISKSQHPVLGRHRGHMPARLGAAAARLGAGAHLWVVSQALAVLRAALADLRAHAAYTRVQIGAAQHKVRAGLADLGTVEQ